MKVCFKTYGCTYNQADSDAMAELLQRSGCELVSEKQADVLVVNTCCVKDATEQKELHLLSRIKKPLVVAGCLAQVSPELVEKANPSASVVGTFAQGRIVEAVEAAATGKRVKLLEKSVVLRNASSVSGVVGRIKISRGCLGACSFCQTKLARGHLESVPADEIIRLARELLRQGAVELQLTSQDCGCYGFDFGEDVASLLEALSSLNGLFRIRLGMANPEHVKLSLPRLLQAMRSEKAYKFLHVPVQSGSDAVLASMNRPYEAKAFEEIARAFREFPNGTLATDVIVGYPTETENDFEQTLALLEKTQPDIVNVSKYSARPKTSAARLPQLPNKVVKKRSEVASALCKRIALKNNARFVGSSLRVLAVEKAFGKGVLCRSDDYRPVVLNEAVLGQAYDILVEEAGRSYLRASIICPEASLQACSQG